VLQQIAPDIHGATSEIKMPGGVHFPLRMTIVCLPDGALWLHSPIRIDDALAAEIERLGKVSYLVAPNCFHHLFVKKAQRRWPDAKIYAAPGLEKKRPDMPIEAGLTEQAPEVWSDVMNQYVVEGVPKLGEVVFLHKPSKTLIVTDLLFNIVEPKGWQSKLAFTLAGVKGRFAQSRLIRTVTKDRKRAGEVCRGILAQDFERVVVTHGEIVTEDVKARMEKGLAWMLR